MSVLGEVQHEELLPSGQMPRRSEIVRTETNLDLPVGPSERSAGCRDLLGDALPDETLLLPSRQMPRRSEIVSHAPDVALGHLSLEQVPVRTLGGHVAPTEVGPSERSAGCRDLLGDALPDVTLLLPPGQMPSRLEIVSLERDPVRTPGGRVAPLKVGPTKMTWA